MDIGMPSDACDSIIMGGNVEFQMTSRHTPYLDHSRPAYAETPPMHQTHDTARNDLEAYLLLKYVSNLERNDSHSLGENLQSRYIHSSNSPADAQ